MSVDTYAGKNELYCLLRIDKSEWNYFHFNENCKEEAYREKIERPKTKTATQS